MSFRNQRKNLMRVRGNPEVVLHVGQPKTGTSVIQRFCVGNRRFLERHGYFYPPHPIDKNGVSAGHGAIYRGLHKGAPDPREIFLNHLKEAKSHNCKLLLSSELFWNTLDTLVPLLRDFDFAIVALFRHPTDRTVSSYNQAVKRSFYTKNFQSFLSYLETQGLNQHILLENWINTVGAERIIANPYQKSLLLQTGMAAAFLNILNIRPPASLFKHRSDVLNSSYLPEYLELKRMLNLILDKNDKGTNLKIDWILQKASDRYNTCHVKNQEKQIFKIDADSYRKLDAESTAFAAQLSRLMTRMPESEVVFEQGEQVQTTNLAQRVQALDFSEVTPLIRQRIALAQNRSHLPPDERAQLILLDKLFPE
ncbi:MAG: hypothetical protein JXX14_23215 [Deltaproteobacteria bacterium]|nr:hypothetical protein [Deltaproteobacteria bacterium]